LVKIIPEQPSDPPAPQFLGRHENLKGWTNQNTRREWVEDAGTASRKI